MSFWKSPLVKNFEQGKFPEVETSVVWDRQNMVDTLTAIGTVIALLMLLFFLMKKYA